MKQFIEEYVEAARIWYDKDADYFAALVSYYSVFAVAPLLLISILLVGAFFGEELVATVFIQWGTILGPNVIAFLTMAVANLREVSSDYSIPTVGILFFSGVIIVGLNAFTGGLHALWSIPHQGVRGWVKKSIRSIVFVIFLQCFIAVSVGMHAFLFAAIGRLFDDNLPFAVLLSVLTILVYLVAHALLFAAAFRVLPIDSPRFPSLFAGGLVASVLFLIGKYLVSFYVLQTPVPGLYEGAGLLIVLLIWIYVSVAIVLYGACFAYVHSGKKLRKDGSL